MAAPAGGRVRRAGPVGSARCRDWKQSIDEDLSGTFERHRSDFEFPPLRVDLEHEGTNRTGAAYLVDRAHPPTMRRSACTQAARQPGPILEIARVEGELAGRVGTAPG